MVFSEGSNSSLSEDYIAGVEYGLRLAIELASSIRSFAAVAKISQALSYVRKTGQPPVSPLPPNADAERP